MNKVNIRESLRQIDDETYCKYDLLTMYDSCNLSDEEKGKIAKLLVDKDDPEVIYQKLALNFGDDNVDELCSSSETSMFDELISQTSNKLSEYYSQVVYNDNSHQFNITCEDGRTIAVSVVPGDLGLSKYEFYLDNICESPYTCDTVEDAKQLIVTHVRDKINSTSGNTLDANAYNDDMCYTVYDIFEDSGHVTAKCMLESTNDFTDVTLGKVGGTKITKMINNLLNNPSYKMNDSTKQKLNKYLGSPVLMLSDTDADATNELLGTSTSADSVGTVTESVQFNKNDRVKEKWANPYRMGRVLKSDDEMVFVEWDYSDSDDIEWVESDNVELINESPLKHSDVDSQYVSSESDNNLSDDFSDDEFANIYGEDTCSDNAPCSIELLDDEDEQQSVYEPASLNTPERCGYAKAVLNANTDIELSDLISDFASQDQDVYKKATEIMNDKSLSLGAKTQRISDMLYLTEDVTQVPQEFDSAATSINSTKLPAIYRMIDLKPGSVVVDFGGGRFDNAVEYLKDKDVTLYVYDPYNRSADHNSEVLAALKANGGADAAINSNVLNVIKESEARKNVLENIKQITKKGAPIYITVYEGNGKGDEGPTKAGYQLNRKTGGYMDEILEILPNATRKGKLITAINESVNKTHTLSESTAEDFFTKEDLLEFADSVCENLTEKYHETFNIYNAYIEGNDIYMDVESDSATANSIVKIDFRSLKKPSDINKYVIRMVNNLSPTLDSVFNSTLTESISGRCVWFDYADLNGSKEPQADEILVKYNDIYSDSISSVTLEFENSNCANHEYTFVATDNDGNRFRVIVGKVPDKNLTEGALATIGMAALGAAATGFGSRVADKIFGESVESPQLSQSLADEFERFVLARDNIYLDNVAYNPNNDAIEFDIEQGDWKHEHIAAYQRSVIFFTAKDIPVSIKKSITEEDGSDTYSAHYVITPDASQFD